MEPLLPQINKRVGILWESKVFAKNMWHTSTCSTCNKTVEVGLSIFRFGNKSKHK